MGETGVRRPEIDDAEVLGNGLATIWADGGLVFVAVAFAVIRGIIGAGRFVVLVTAPQYLLVVGGAPPAELVPASEGWPAAR